MMDRLGIMAMGCSGVSCTLSPPGQRHSDGSALSGSFFPGVPSIRTLLPDLKIDRKHGTVPDQLQAAAVVFQFFDFDGERFGDFIL